MILAILAVTAGLFLWGRYRHDMVAAAALLAAVFTGLVPAESAFDGFSHPAVITVACILALSSSLQSSGAVGILTRTVLPAKAGPLLAIGGITILAAALSGFMNNVGALALLMPVALQAADRLDLPPSRMLMPVAFGSILGGMTTLIGTPPNLIVSSYRAEAGLGQFQIFDFAPVGLAVAGLGVAFILLVGWRLVPDRRRATGADFAAGSYLSEVVVPEDSKAAGMRLREVESALQQAEAQILALYRDKVNIPAPNPVRRVQAGDLLLIEADPKELMAVLPALNLSFAEPKPDPEAESDQPERELPTPAGLIQADDVVLMEMVVLPGSPLIDRTVSGVRLRQRFNLNLLSISRHGSSAMARIARMRIRAGDVLLMQGPAASMQEFSSHFSCVPLIERDLQMPDGQKAATASGIMAGSVGLAAFGVLPAAIAFMAGVLAALLTKTLSLKTLYDAVDWPVIVLLACLIPVANALGTTGSADLLAQSLMTHVAAGNAVLTALVILVVTMTLSDFMNNAATAAVMCPVALSAAEALSVNPDPLLMCVAVGASCAFLTPIGHQNNTLILGPGGFKFSDYWRLGLPLEILVVIVALPMILLVWPL